MRGTMSVAENMVARQERVQTAVPPLRFVLDRSAGEWRVEAECSGLGAATVARIALPRLTDERGAEHAPHIVDVRVEADAAEWLVVFVAGDYPRASGLRWASRWQFDRASGLVQSDVTLQNPRVAKHRGGLWDLGDAGSVLFKDFSLTVTSEAAATITYQAEPGQERREAGERLEIYQDSSGGENWDSQNHVGRDGIVTTRFRGYRGTAGAERLEGLRAEPVVEMAGDEFNIAAMLPEFWQQFPKAIEADEGQITLRLFPRQTAELFELQGGEQKTHRVCLLFRPSATEGDAMDGLRTSIESHQRPEKSLPSVPGLPRVAGGDPRVLARLDELLAQFLDGPRGLIARREEVDEYGWRHWGELHADHEELHYSGPRPLISHYNNQFDPLCGFLLQWLRTGEPQWLELATPLVRHIIDIDIYRTTADRPAYCGGLFWFTDHYLHARTSTHRTFSRHNQCAGQSYGGGPGAEHNFTTGLLLFHRLTGDPPAREAVISLADWVLAMDDGSRTLLGAVDDGPTGLASLTGDPLYHGPGRGSGNSISVLLDGWLLTGDRRYLSYAETLIRRCIHPQSDIAALDLSNAEKRWSYTVFIVSLAKYLTCKADAGEIDAEYGYAQVSLGQLGRWMLEHERPYFDRKDELQYPTEAWPAQELRKANALRLAAAHEDEPLRTRMLDRGDELADRAWSDLLSCEKPTTTRAMAVVMIEGLRDAELRCRDTRPMPRFTGPVTFSRHEPFVPQRERIKRKLRSAGGLLSLIAALVNPRRWPRLLNPR